MRHPGQLTIEYYEGKRAGYLSPFQIFFWLQALAFAANAAFFAHPEQTEATSRLVLILGCCIATVLGIVHYRAQPKFLFHLIATVHIWAFLMLVLLAEYAVIPVVIGYLIRRKLISGEIHEGLIITVIAEIAIVIYMTVAIHRIYRTSWLSSIIQTSLMLFAFTVIAHFLKS